MGLEDLKRERELYVNGEELRAPPCICEYVLVVCIYGQTNEGINGKEEAR